MIPLINRSWGARLRRWLALPETFALLNPLSPTDAEFPSWHSGGCRVLACALHSVLAKKPAYGLASLKIIASTESPVDHVVLQLSTTSNGVWYLDADGASRKRTLLTRFAKRESRTNVRLITYDGSLLDDYEIQCPPKKLAELIKQLDRQIQYW